MHEVEFSATDFAGEKFQRCAGGYVNVVFRRP
jgi:hypothetical protein